MDIIARLISCTCYLLVLFPCKLDAIKNTFRSSVGDYGNGIVQQRAGFAGFGMDAMCALCIRMGNYQCYLRYCAGARGGFGGAGFVVGDLAGMGGLPPPVSRIDMIPWNPTCAMCMTDACRRLWCASGRVAAGFGLASSGPGRGSGFGPNAYYPGYSGNGVMGGYMTSPRISRKVNNYKNRQYY